MADDPERDDPVLVRPYITTQPAGSPDRPAQTWPAAADLPEDDTREQPRAQSAPEPAAKTTALRRQRLRLLAVIGVLALIGGAVLLLTVPSDRDELPAAAGPAPIVTPLTGAPGAAPVASGGARSLAPSSSGASPSATGATTTTAPGTAPGAPAAPNGTPPPASGAPAPTLSPPPGAARTGPIEAAGGRCLVRGTLLGLDGSPVQTTGCSDVVFQRWTLATDGTLRVTDRCARVSDDATVRLNACGDQPTDQWRAGPNGSLVNPGTGRCLTDPGSLGATVTVTNCTGADTQRWTLP